MNRSVGRRYLPLAVVIAAQLLIISLAPSKAPSSQEVASGGGGFETGNGDVTTGDGSPEDTTGGGGGTGEGGGNGGSGGGGGDGGGGGGDGTGGGPAAGDTSHCVDGRQFDPKIDFYAPPCVPKWTGGDNGGTTYQGVTDDKITIVRYYAKGNDAVDAILRASGSYISAGQHRQFQPVAQKFINEHYELYGRQVELKLVEGNCNTIPPDTVCLRNEMKALVARHKPYFVYWNTSLSSASFETLSKLRTPNVGGWHFRDEFNQRMRPYHWDVQMSGTRIAQHAGRWYCAQLHGRKAKYAPDLNTTERLSQFPRRLGVISTNDPQNETTVTVDLKRELAKCGASYGNRTYFYEQDITTADQQRRAAIIRMRENQIGPAADSKRVATTVMCFCDLVAPEFLYAEETQQNYYPENVLVGTGQMDKDSAGQSYERGTIACPTRQRCSFPGAFGLGQINKQELVEDTRGDDPIPKYQDTGSRVWRAGGGRGFPPFTDVTSEWHYLNLMSTLIQGAGPNLNPQTMEQGAWKLGTRGDNQHVARGFFPGNYAWNLTMRLVYYSQKTQSSYNLENGSYVQIGPRYAVSDWRRSELRLPPMPR